jgi:hypothetical protein
MKPDDIGNATFGMHQSAHVLFDHVFIPNERVFLCGQWKAARDLVHRFSDFQRFASASCRCGYIDLCIGAGLAMADFNGVAQVGHIREKLTDMSIDAETLYGLVAGSAALAGITALVLDGLQSGSVPSRGSRMIAPRLHLQPLNSPRTGGDELWLKLGDGGLRKAAYRGG